MFYRRIHGELNTLDLFNKENVIWLTLDGVLPFMTYKEFKDKQRAEDEEFRLRYTFDFNKGTATFHNSVPPIQMHLAGKQINTSVFEEAEIIELIPNR